MCRWIWKYFYDHLNFDVVFVFASLACHPDAVDIVNGNDDNSILYTHTRNNKQLIKLKQPRAYKQVSLAGEHKWIQWVETNSSTSSSFVVVVSVANAVALAAMIQNNFHFLRVTPPNVPVWWIFTHESRIFRFVFKAIVVAAASVCRRKKKKQKKTKDWKPISYTFFFSRFFFLSFELKDAKKNSFCMDDSGDDNEKKNINK